MTFAHLKVKTIKMKSSWLLQQNANYAMSAAESWSLLLAGGSGTLFWEIYESFTSFYEPDQQDHV